MTMTTRPRRNAAIVASIKIKQYYTPSNQPLTAQFPRTHQVLKTRDYIQKCLEEAISKPEKKISIIIDMFRHLIIHPMILVLHPRFRDVVTEKMNEFELHIHAMHGVEKKVDDLQCTVHRLISNTDIEKEVTVHLDAIRRIYSKYCQEKNMSELDTLQQVMNRLRTTIKELWSHPDYVSK